MPITLLLADDHGIVRQGLKVLLESNPAFTVVAEASNGLEAIGLTLQHRPDVAILDLSMPEKNGVDATIELRAKGYIGPILILSGHNDPLLIEKCKAAGASGFVVKQTDLTELTAAITTCLQGGTSFASSKPVAKISEPDALAQIALLTPRERQILVLLAQGKSAKVIGDELGLSHKTISVHRQNFTTKLGLTNLADLARLAVRAGLTGL